MSEELLAATIPLDALERVLVMAMQFHADHALGIEDIDAIRLIEREIQGVRDAAQRAK